ncbi:tripartite-type tricarboxylate transporter receptor subunit TctC [Humitalea rosea]|uniref:Tripartite-type tricarboxylate transporter receptor subunit TctC n=1 Tax=Humitalea rosea TaxID=990373 RepID=A0A2W7I0A8_9PROT|nr:tripartite tricarboxylate transporter substrate binding protein [Humitalea rosea]PZW38892.1 tripartite-type tricarboxylate transporter receptor subunit TctC [Humitalea rosea]
MTVMTGSPLTSASRRSLLALLSLAAPWRAGAWAQGYPDRGYPDRPVRLYIGYPPGGGTDFVARIAASTLTQALRQQVLVINTPGASGAIALERVVRSPPDGHSLIMISAADTILPALRARLPFDMGRDLVPVAPTATGALGLVVNPALPARSVLELIALARARPGELNYGSPGVGNSQHLAGELFNRLADIRIVHVPFRGGAEAISATVSGDIQLCFASLSAALPLIESRRLRLLAVTPKVRSASVPETPTIWEAGLPGYDRSTWFGIAAPAGLPREILLVLNTALSAGMRGAETRQLLQGQGLEPMTATPEEFSAFVRSELTENAQLVRSMGIAAE